MDRFTAEWDTQELCIRYVSGLRNYNVVPLTSSAIPATIRIDNGSRGRHYLLYQRNLEFDLHFVLHLYGPAADRDRCNSEVGLL
ncbi:MAG: hypothetical protein JWO91_3605 [Acidobacteriaceae bacterium]|jgi:hypothetical protein|nr:hypothetical protein [Acidobacteriaceae bacterium]